VEAYLALLSRSDVTPVAVDGDGGDPGATEETTPAPKKKKKK
jgi:hypothetical protein